MLMTYGYSFYKTISYSLYIKHQINNIYSYYNYLSYIPKYLYTKTIIDKKNDKLDIHFDEWILLDKN